MYKFAVIIDDDPISILVCETMLKKADFVESVKTFNNPKTALAFMKNHYDAGGTLPDFIFLDVQMPEMEGWDFLKAYRQLPNLPMLLPHVVMLSAVYDPQDQERSANNELVLSFISKPITLEALENLHQLK